MNVLQREKKLKRRRLYIKMDVLHHSVLLDVFISPVQGSAHEERREFTDGFSSCGMFPSSSGILIPTIVLLFFFLIKM